MHGFLRRDFLRLVIVSAAAGAAPACAGDEAPVTAETVFPQGVASGDPKPGSVVLWTRAVSPDGAPHRVGYEVARDPSFSELVASGETEVGPNSDFTLHLKVTDLDPFTIYHYRFSAQGVMSPTGRTKTAPEAGDDATVRFAFASCQDFNGRYYHSWQALLDEPDVDFVLFLGDYIYETEGDPRFQNPTEERSVEVPDGLQLGEGDRTYNAALTLRDYRTVYRTYRSDPHLKEVHRRFPFVMMWDDHEFANDCWRDHATDFDGAEGNEKSTERRMAATRAWHEYQPVDIEHHPEAGFPDDITVYRKLRFGRNLELFATDQRYYRDDHVIPEGPVNVEVGKVEENSSLGSRSLVLKKGFDPIEAMEAPTMLGDTQKAWLVDAITGSEATWKVWANETQLSQMLVDLSGVMELPESFRDTFYFTVDQWDGYRSERAEILSALEGVDNLAVLTGDIHAFYASELQVDFDAPATPMAVEYTCAGISSSPVQESVQRTVDSSETLTDLGLGEVVPKFDELVAQASPHYKYLASLANGIAICEIAATEMHVTFLAVSDVQDPEPGGVERTRFRTPAGTSTVELL